jgi:hypothetical protein
VCVIKKWEGQGGEATLATTPDAHCHPARNSLPAKDRRVVFGGEEEGGGVRSGPGAARTILLFHIISDRPSKQHVPF